MGTLSEYAELELAAIGYDDKCEEYDKMVRDSILELIEVFSNQGHSGFSAPHCLDIFNKLARFEPLQPILCTDDEWSDVSDVSNMPFFQNKRHSAIFKEGEDARPYFLDAIVWVGREGERFTGEVEGITSVQFIKVPFIPKTFYIKIDSDNNIIERKKLQEALEYYDYHGGTITEINHER